MKPYPYNPIGLLPWGEMWLQRYDDTDGLYHTVETMKNKTESVVVGRRFFGLFASTETLYEYTEDEWRKAAIARAKELGCHRVVFHDWNEHGDRTETLWNAATGQRLGLV